MAEQRKNRIPNAVTKTLLCVNGQENSDYSGMLYNRYLPEPVAFEQIKDVIHVMEQFFDSIAYPQPYFEQRTFRNAQEHPAKPIKIPQLYQSEDVFAQRGNLATFLVEVKQRQNASWQGSVSWLEGNASASFESILELLRFMIHTVEQGVFIT